MYQQWHLTLLVAIETGPASIDYKNVFICLLFWSIVLYLLHLLGALGVDSSIIKSVLNTTTDIT